MLNSASVLRKEQVIKPQGGSAQSVHWKKKQQVPPVGDLLFSSEYFWPPILLKTRETQKERRDASPCPYP
jgi:hypothetical protein